MRASSLPLHTARRRTGVRATAALFLTIVAVAIYPAFADNTAQMLPFSQAWTSTGLITVNDDWSGVPGVIGYRGDGLVGGSGVDPQTVIADGTGTPVDVNANQTNPNTFATGGVSEFEITDPVVALQGSGTADAPFILLNLNTTSGIGITVSYNLRDIDGSLDNAVQPVALQYRVGNSGNFTNLPAGFVPDASTGPSLATLVTPVSVTLPPAADNQPLVQVRVITTDAGGFDEWIGIDDISVTAATVLTVTTTTLTVTPAKTTFGGKVTLDAEVSPFPNDGETVNFFDGATPIGSASLEAGHAVLSISTLAVGSHSLTARYPGNATNKSSTSTAVSHEVNPIATTTSLTVTPEKTALGEKVTLDAQVTPIPSVGSTVNFFDGGSPIGSANTDATGHAILSITTLAIGSHSLEATYKGDATHSASTSPVVAHEVNLVATSTVLVVTPDKTFSGEKVTLDAEVTPIPAPESVVNFFDGGNPIGSANTDATGHAVLSIATLAVGSHSLTATFKGDATHSSSTSNQVTHEVNPLISDIAVTFVCATLPSTVEPKPCASVIFTQQDWHVQFTVVNRGQKPLDQWSYDIILDATSANPINLKTQIGGAPIPVNGAATINWDSPYIFDATGKGPHTVTVRATVKDPTNPEPPELQGDNVASGTFTVENKPLVSDIGIANVCVTDPNKLCTAVVYVAQDWHVLFTAQNKGEKDVNNWSYDIDLVQGTTTIPLKTQVTGPPLAVGRAVTINWDSPFTFDLTQAGEWSIVLTLTVKDPTNPDPNQGNNRQAVSFTVNTKPTATLLSLFQAEPVVRGLELRWQFGDPSGIAGVDLERARSAVGPWAAVSTERRDEGGVTVALDAGVEAGVTYYYRLLARTTGGSTMTFGPLAGTAGALLVEFALPRVSPNPARGAANIEFVVPREAQVRVSVVDLQGREMALLKDGTLRPGRYQATWGGQTAHGDAPAGLYFVRYQTPERDLAQRFAFIR